MRPALLAGLVLGGLCPPLFGESPRAATPPGGPATVQFTDVAAEVGLVAPNVSGRDQKYIVETSIGGTAFLDYDNDGDVDLYVANGSSFHGFPEGEHPRNRLYRNDGGNFTEVTAAAAVGDSSWSLGCAAADYDNDGHLDLYVGNFGRNTLYRNLGNRRFADVTSEAGVGDEGYGTASTFGDYDRDGDLDLYVSNYIDFSLDYESTVPCVWKTYDIMCGPRGMIPQADVFYRNDGNGSFTDVTDEVGMAGRKYYGYGAVFADFTDDGWPDLFVADDMTPNMMFVNKGDGTFSDEALGSGVGFDAEGTEQGCMGVGVGDYDNDGDKDIFVANGHTYPEANLPHTNASYAQLNLLFENLGNGTFRDVSRESGPGLAIREVSRGAGFADYDADGDIDIFVLNLNGKPNLLRNDGGNANNCLLVKTVGSVSNRDGVGTRIELEAAGHRQVNEVRSGGSYLGHDDMRVHFGLGKTGRVDRVTLRWPSGIVQTLEDVEVNQVLTVTEPEG